MKIRLSKIFIALFLLFSFCAESTYGQNNYSVTVFGTEIITKQSVLKKYQNQLNTLRGLYENDREKYRVEKDVLAKKICEVHGFSYVNVRFFRSYSGTVDLIIDAVEKKDAARRLDYRSIKVKDIKDPKGLLTKWTEYQRLSFDLYRKNEISDMSCPVIHCVWSFNHPKLAPYLTFLNEKAPSEKEKLIAILNTSNSPDDRAAASFTLAHANMENGELLKTLLPSVRDPESVVRNNSLRVIYYIVRANPNLDFDVSEVITTLDFPSFTDRNKALVILRSLPSSRFSKENLKRMLPILLKILEKKDAHNYRNAHTVIKNISGKDYGSDDLQKWESWVNTQIK